MRDFIVHFKPVFQSILLLLLSSIFFGLAVIGIKNQNVDLAQIDTYTGKVVSTGETIRHSKRSVKVFFVSLKGLAQTLGVYRMSKNYDDLLREVKEDDVLTVYYKKNNSDKINIDLVQIEKRKRVLLNKKEFEEKESFLIWVGLFGGLLFVGLSIYKYKKYFISGIKTPHTR